MTEQPPERADYEDPASYYRAFGGQIPTAKPPEVRVAPPITTPPVISQPDTNQEVKSDETQLPIVKQSDDQPEVKIPQPEEIQPLVEIDSVEVAPTFAETEITEGEFRVFEVEPTTDTDFSHDEQPPATQPPQILSMVKADSTLPAVHETQDMVKEALGVLNQQAEMYRRKAKRDDAVQAVNSAYTQVVKPTTEEWKSLQYREAKNAFTEINKAASYHFTAALGDTFEDDRQELLTSVTEIRDKQELLLGKIQLILTTESDHHNELEHLLSDLQVRFSELRLQEQKLALDPPNTLTGKKAEQYALKLETVTTQIKETEKSIRTTTNIIPELGNQLTTMHTAVIEGLTEQVESFIDHSINAQELTESRVYDESGDYLTASEVAKSETLIALDSLLRTAVINVPTRETQDRRIDPNYLKTSASNINRGLLTMMQHDPEFAVQMYKKMITTLGQSDLKSSPGLTNFRGQVVEIGRDITQLFTNHIETNESLGDASEPKIADLMEETLSATGEYLLLEQISSQQFVEEIDNCIAAFEKAISITRQNNPDQALRFQNAWHSVIMTRVSQDSKTEVKSDRHNRSLFRLREGFAHTVSQVFPSFFETDLIFSDPETLVLTQSRILNLLFHPDLTNPEYQQLVQTLSWTNAEAIKRAFAKNPDLSTAMVVRSELSILDEIDQSTQRTYPQPIREAIDTTIGAHIELVDNMAKPGYGVDSHSAERLLAYTQILLERGLDPRIVSVVNPEVIDQIGAVYQKATLSQQTPETESLTMRLREYFVEKIAQNRQDGQNPDILHTHLVALQGKILLEHANREPQTDLHTYEKYYLDTLRGLVATVLHPDFIKESSKSAIIRAGQDIKQASLTRLQEPTAMMAIHGLAEVGKQIQAPLPVNVVDSVYLAEPLKVEEATGINQFVMDFADASAKAIIWENANGSSPAFRYRAVNLIEQSGGFVATTPTLIDQIKTQLDSTDPESSVYSHQLSYLHQLSPEVLTALLNLSRREYELFEENELVTTDFRTRFIRQNASTQIGLINALGSKEKDIQQVFDQLLTLNQTNNTKKLEVQAGLPKGNGRKGWLSRLPFSQT